ncbi:hypothetical protein [uncultured Polaribacter sp.]|uniref:hypothetical protein n=1 Tax=uncultured Polaribacter sp. TaxID=174711 RepID=UPI00261630C8|nr:hypothetical protein [uncultured Polaribacter sp.]
MTNEEINNILRQPIISWEQNKIERAKNAEKFIFSYLIKKGGKANIYNLLLIENGFSYGLKTFLKDIEFYTTTPLINILKQSKNKTTLELTLSGELFYKDKPKIEVKIPSYFFILKVFVSSFLNKIWNFIYITLDRFFKKFFNSGWWLLIAAILAFIYFILPYINQLSENQKKDKETIKKESILKNISKNKSELSVSSKDSVFQKKDSLKTEKKTTNEQY